MAENRIIKFCAQVGLRSISVVMTNCPPDRRGQGRARDVLILWQISVNVSKTVQDRHILTMED